LGREPSVKERDQVNETLHAGWRGNEGAEIAEGSRDIGVEAGECRIGAMCTDLRDRAENLVLLSFDGGFLLSFREHMKRFHDLARQKNYIHIYNLFYHVLCM
jgi:hypothetical protein